MVIDARGVCVKGKQVAFFCEVPGTCIGFVSNRMRRVFLTGTYCDEQAPSFAEEEDGFAATLLNVRVFWPVKDALRELFIEDEQDREDIVFCALTQLQRLGYARDVDAEFLSQYG